MKLDGMEEYTGKVYSQFLKDSGTIVVSERGKFFLSKRSKTFSEPSAIKKVSDYGIAPVIWVGESNILQPFVNFEPIKPELKNLAEIMKKIHSNKQNNLTLVHGDFGSHNTTTYLGETKCFDYEYSHWGSPYIDLGRVVLRECKSEEDVNLLLENYFGGIPSLQELKLGFMDFCQRQYEMRREKNQDFQEVPLIRAKRLSKSGSTLAEILHAFKDPVTL